MKNTLQIIAVLFIAAIFPVTAIAGDYNQQNQQHGNAPSYNYQKHSYDNYQRSKKRYQSNPTPHNEQIMQQREQIWQKREKQYEEKNWK